MNEIMDSLLRHYMNQDIAVFHYNSETDKTEIEWEHNIEEVKFIEIK